MIGSHWQLGLVAGLIVLHAVLVYRSYRHQKKGATTSTGSAGPGTARVDIEAGVVECPGCGADNELGYRYCRSCVTELPASMDFTRNVGDPRGRFAR